MTIMQVKMMANPINSSDRSRFTRLVAASTSGVGVPSALLLGGILLLVVGFAGVLDTTVLGAYLFGLVRPFHLVIGRGAL
jgi:hypothetical protein